VRLDWSPRSLSEATLGGGVLRFGATGRAPFFVRGTFGIGHRAYELLLHLLAQCGEFVGEIGWPCRCSGPVERPRRFGFATAECCPPSESSARSHGTLATGARSRGCAAIDGAW
jgi:hypothetical protein